MSLIAKHARFSKKLGHIPFLVHLFLFLSPHALLFPSQLPPCSVHCLTFFWPQITIPPQQASSGLLRHVRAAQCMHQTMPNMRSTGSTELPRFQVMGKLANCVCSTTSNSHSCGLRTCLRAKKRWRQLLARRMTYTQSLDVSPFWNVKVSIESATGPWGIIAVALFKSYAAFYVLKRSI